MINIFIIADKQYLVKKGFRSHLPKISHIGSAIFNHWQFKCTFLVLRLERQYAQGFITVVVSAPSKWRQSALDHPVLF